MKQALEDIILILINLPLLLRLLLIEGNPINKALFAIVKLLKISDKIPQILDLTKISVPRVQNKELQITPINQREYQNPSKTTIDFLTNIIPYDKSEYDTL